MNNFQIPNVFLEHCFKDLNKNDVFYFYLFFPLLPFSDFRLSTTFFWFDTIAAFCCIYTKEISDMNNKEKIEAAHKKKEKGESLHWRREYARASKRFEKVTKLHWYISPSSTTVR